MKRKAFWKSLRRDRQLVFMLIPVVIFFAVFPTILCMES